MASLGLQALTCVSTVISGVVDVISSLGGGNSDAVDHSFQPPTATDRKSMISH